MKELMKKAWAIYRTLTIGTHFEKLSVALRRAWKEVKAMTMTLKRDLGYIGKDVSTGEIFRNGEERLTIINFELSLSELQGSEKQIAWAEDIRSKKINDMVDFTIKQVKSFGGAEAGIENFHKKGINVDTINGLVKFVCTSKLKELISETSAKAIIEA